MKGASRMTNKELAIHVGNKIRALRKSKNWTQHQLATQLNTTKATISNYETGYRSPKKDMLFRAPLKTYEKSYNRLKIS